MLSLYGLLNSLFASILLAFRSQFPSIALQILRAVEPHLPKNGASAAAGIGRSAVHGIQEPAAVASTSHGGY